MCAEPSPLYAAARERILLAAHRGVAGGNIPCNTLAAYEIALRQGADIVELDVAPSRDGTLFVFHPGMEFPHLRSSQPIAALTDREVETLRFVNQDGTPTRHPVVRLEEALAFLRGRCFVNIDKFWTCMSEIAAVVRRLGMEDQVIVKTPAERKWFDLVEETAPDLPFMPVISEEDICSEELLRRRIRFIGAEILFREETSPTAQRAYWDWMHDHRLLLWVNAIVYDDQAVLAAGHSDDLSLTGDPDQGWGWLAGRGVDIIQTDWVLALRRYLQQTGREQRT